MENHDETNLICFGYAGPVGRRSPCPDEHNDRHDNNDDDYDDQTNHYRKGNRHYYHWQHYELELG
ncbi:hypothetical protein GGE12_000556 [Rhizobium mongolense]|uniref:Uncharacterized protein n=1 Tax=Rhizobium mongolense TaxID=57676 RepID=A0A7W6RI40_9HYPH|nr:hypothetical protein [Rhizobium mongolense]